MAPPKDKKPGIKLEDLCFYFDGVERDRLDAAGLSRKSGEVLALRERMLRLSDGAFDSAIKALKSLVDDAAHTDDGAEAAPGKKRRAAELYDTARKAGRGGTGQTGKVSPA